MDKNEIENVLTTIVTILIHRGICTEDEMKEVHELVKQTKE